MIIPKKLRKGSKVAIVSLSSGILGESFCRTQLDLGIRRMKEMGLIPVLMPNTLKGTEYLSQHPEARAADLKAAFADDEIDGILTAIGGDDTFRLAPFLLEDDTFADNVTQHPKIFMGYSDTTVDHLMLYKLGLQTYYGPAFLTCFAEYAPEMLPYTRAAIESLFEGNEMTEITSSPVWYEDRTDFSPRQAGTPRKEHREEHGFELLQGKEGFSGELLGGCIESLSDLLTGERYPEELDIQKKYRIFPDVAEWRGKILFIETSEEKMSPEKYGQALKTLRDFGVFEVINGIIAGKPMDEQYYEEYKQMILDVTADTDLPVLYNLNFGHAFPKTVLPYGARVVCYHDKVVITPSTAL